MIKIQIKSVFGKVIFEYEKENNNIKKTLQEAVLRVADLRGADLRRADLTGAYLRGAHLTGAHLTGADLTGAHLTGADLRGAYLTGADLTGAHLTGADLTGAHLTGADLTGADLTGAHLTGADLRRADLTGADLRGVYLPIFCKWSHSIINGKIRIGCETKTPEEWAEWLNSNKEYETRRGTLEFKRIEATIKAYISYIETMGNDLYN
jgi:uncharacterized protein YjbI with pentapeptide repeats